MVGIQGLKRFSNGVGGVGSSEVCPRETTKICDKCAKIKENSHIAVVRRAFEKLGEEIFLNYESGGQEFESLRARQFSNHSEVKLGTEAWYACRTKLAQAKWHRWLAGKL
jgi:hypothetical protein